MPGVALPLYSCLRLIAKNATTAAVAAAPRPAQKIQRRRSGTGSGASFETFEIRGEGTAGGGEAVKTGAAIDAAASSARARTAHADNVTTTTIAQTRRPIGRMLTRA